MEGASNQSTSKRVKLGKETSIDDIPRDLIRVIVSHLPILEAGRASVLSTNWRNQWTTLPDVIFNDSTIPESMRDGIINIVNRVLSQHVGPINKFEYCNLPVMEPILDEWFLHLCRKNVKVLKCTFFNHNAWFNDRPCILPSTVYSCNELVQAEFHYIEIRVPVSFKSFDNLVSLHLEDVMIVGDEIAYLVARCPLLQKLVLKNFFGCNRLTFSAPNLRELEICGSFNDVYFENTPHLANFSITKLGQIYANDILDSYNLIRSLAGALELESLNFGDGIIEFMTQGREVSGLPVFLHLKRLHFVDINLLNQVQVNILCCFLQCCPSLEELVVYADSYTYEAEDRSLCHGDGWESLRFNNLKYFFYKDYAPGRDLVLIKRVFANAPVLERFRLGMDLEVAVTNNIYKHINKLPRPSTLTEIL